METETEAELLMLGKGEIVRALCALAVAVGYRVRVVEPGAAALAWPPGVTVLEQVYSDAPYPLPPHTHAVIARGHEGDAASVAALLNHGAERVYLIASARRSLSVIEAATPQVEDPARLARLSAPAGLDLGGKGSGEIALSILAEIQQRRHGGSGLALCDIREQRAQRPPSVTSDEACPGKRE